MSILTILAILGIAVGIIALIQEKRFNGQRSYAVIVALIVASIGLLVLAGVASSQKSQKRGDQLIAQNDSAADAAQNSANGAEAPEKAAEAPEKAAQPEKADNVAQANNFAPTIAEPEKAAQPEKADNVAQADNAAPTIAEPEKAAQPEKADNVAQADNAAPTIAEPEKAAQPEKADNVAVADNAAPAEPEKAAPAAPTVVEDDPLAPNAVAGNLHDDAKINEVIAFTARKSKKKSKGAEIVSYHWDFADGTTSNERDVKHSYDKIGTYDVVLTVTDKAGRSAKAIRRIMVNRPESKIHFLRRDIKDAKTPDNAPDPITGTYAKQFSGSTINLEAKGFILSGENCECTVQVAIQGDTCNATRNKSLKNGGEGNLGVKASCKGDPANITWTVTRKASGDCACTFNDFRIEANES